MLEDRFKGTAADPRYWAAGYSRENDDTTLRIEDGVVMSMTGPNYSGGALFTTFSINGSFDARVAFEVEKPLTVY